MRMGEKDNRLDERDLEASKGALPAEEAVEPLALPVHKESRIVLGMPLPFVFPGPGGLVAPTVPGRLLISMRKAPWGQTTSVSTSLIEPSSATSSKSALAR